MADDFLTGAAWSSYEIFIEDVHEIGDFTQMYPYGNARKAG